MKAPRRHRRAEPSVAENGASRCADCRHAPQLRDRRLGGVERQQCRGQSGGRDRGAARRADDRRGGRRLAARGRCVQPVRAPRFRPHRSLLGQGRRGAAAVGVGDEPVDAVRAGFVGIDSPIFYNANTQMLFSDAKAMTGRMVKELSGEDSIKQCG